MRLRYLTADKVFPVYRPPIKHAVVVVDSVGMIRDLVVPDESPEDYRALFANPDLESYSGALVPGLINSHCHLELSHLKGKIPQGTGLPGFLKSVVGLRPSDRDLINEAMVAADREMVSEGIVAVGDISNTSDSISVKSNSRLKYHTFVEVFDLRPDRTEKCLVEGLALRRQFESAGLTATLSPHATYTVTRQLLASLAIQFPFLSIHNQETPSEDAFFKTGTGALADFLLGTGNYNHWTPSGRSALRTVMEELQHCEKLMLVHDTFTSEEDLEWALSASSHLWWCLCPSANRYIEGSLPDPTRLIARDCRLLLGTDSLASNLRLSVMNEINGLMKAFPAIGFETFLKAATSDAADFFGWQIQLGDMTRGKRPGVVLLKQDESQASGYVVDGILAFAN